MRLSTIEKELLSKLVNTNIKRLTGEVNSHKKSGRPTLAHNKFLKELTIMQAIQAKVDK